MVTFKEYYQGDKSMTPMLGNKSIMRTGRKHENLKKQEYNHDCPQVSNLINGHARQIKLAGEPLMAVLKIYGVDYAPGQTKGLGNSGVKVKMYDDKRGNRYGMLIKD